MNFKNFSKISLAISAAATAISANNTFFINEAGYDDNQPVSIVVQSTDELEGTEWTLWFDPEDGSTGSRVAVEKFEKGVNPDNWAKSGKYYVLNLTNIIPTIETVLPTSNHIYEPGHYHIEVATGSPSSSNKFYVGRNALAEKTLGLVMDYFYNDRASAEGIQKQDQALPVYGSSGVTRDVRGGWYDASGDASKYLSHLSYANYLNPQQIPLTVWSLAFTAERIPSLLKTTSTKATALEEAAYGADFLVRMLDEQGFFYMTVFDNWGSPLGRRELCAFTGKDGEKTANYQTAFREGGGMAIAALARTAKQGAKGEFTSEQYLEAAKKAYAHLSEKQGIGKACAYCDDGKENIIDDYTALLAATELFAATGDSPYLDDAKARATHLEGRLSNDGYFWSDDAKTRPFWHASDAGLPLIALARFAEAAAEHERCPGGCSLGETVPKARDAISKHLEWLISVTNETANPFGYARQTYKTGGSIKNGFFIPHDNESNYWWQGEDARLGSLAAAAVFAKRILGDAQSTSGIDQYATNQLDWILGKNPYSTCMMYGIGSKNPERYTGQSSYPTTIKGGIANGITGRNTDGSGIAWDDDGVAYVGFDPEEPWNNWRWIEQWIPHSTWYLMALTARYDEVTKAATPLEGSGIKGTKIAAKFNIQLHGRTLAVNASGARKGSNVEVFSLNGNKIAASQLSAGNATINLSNAQSGIYLVKVEGFAAKKIAVK